MKQFRSQEKEAEYYNGMIKSDGVMKIAIRPARPQQERQVLQALEDAGLLDTVDVEIYLAPGQQRYQERPLMTMCHVHQLERGKDGRARCRLCGRSYPLNRKGKIDEARLLQEILRETHL